MKANVLKALLLFTLLLAFIACTNRTAIEISKTTVELKENPIGIATSQPRFSWQLESDERDVMQTAYHILVASTPKKLTEESADIWNSKKTESHKSILVQFKGESLNPATTYYYSIKVWDNKGNVSNWSKAALFTTTLFSKTDWDGAKWIALDELPDEKRIVPAIHNPKGDKKKWRYFKSGDHKLPILRKELEVEKEVKSALAFICGLGHYELSLNGEKVGDSFIAPGWTDYDSLCLFNTYDITAQVKLGTNAFGVMLGNGFYNIPNVRYRKIMNAFGNPKMICKVEVTYVDGSIESLISDGSWKVKESPVTFSSIFSGETFNATLDPDDWKMPKFNDSRWQNALEVNPPMGKLEPETDYPVKLMEEIEVKEVYHVENKDGQSYLYDFGQNASGVISLQIKGNKGDSVFIYPGELISDDKRVLQGATGKPYYFTYICKGDGIESWQPQFTYYGFRYAKVIGAVPDTTTVKSNLPRIINLTMLHNRNSMPRQGNFSTSFDLFNQVYDLINWAAKSNLQSVATDCPHREKLGWLEQAHLMGTGMYYNYDLYHLYCKVVDDMIYAQTKEGMVPDIAPEYVEFWQDFRDSPEWGSAGVIVPYLIYKWYGDKSQMEKAWDMMTRYVDYLKGRSENHIVDYGLGDWYDLGPERPGYAQLTPKALTATAIYYYDVKLLSEMADVLGRDDEILKYEEWAEEIKVAFNDKFFNANTDIYSTGSQTAIAMPLVVGLAPKGKDKAILETLKASIQKDKKALTAGDVGFFYLVKALQDNDEGELLFEMNARDDVPGYGYQLKKGATALTESWQALGLVSNNHIMLGHIMQWFYSGLGGIAQTNGSVAYSEVKIEPQLVGDIKSVNADFNSPYGKIVSNWIINEREKVFEVEIPVNSSAKIVLPIAETEVLREGGHEIEGKREGEKISIEVGSGNYRFTIK